MLAGRDDFVTFGLRALALARATVGALPLLRHALLNGKVTWSAANLVARHANAESESEEDGDSPPERRTLEHMVDAEEAWTFERTKMLASAVIGGASQDEIIEAALAEALTELLPAADECRELERATDLHTWRSEARQVDAAVRAKMEAYFEQVVTPRPADVTANEPAQPMSPSASSTPSDIDESDSRRVRGAGGARPRARSPRPGD